MHDHLDDIGKPDAKTFSRKLRAAGRSYARLLASGWNPPASGTHRALFFAAALSISQRLVRRIAAATAKRLIDRSIQGTTANVTTAIAAPASRPLRTALVLGLLTALGSFAIDRYLPSLPAIGAGLGVDADSALRSPTAYFLSFALGLMLPGASVLALAQHGEIAGTASSLMNTLQLVTGTAIMGISGHFADGTPLPMVAGIAACAVVASLLAFATLRGAGATDDLARVRRASQ